MKFELWGKTYHLSKETRGVVIFDYDGTLSDGKHRLHLLPTKDLHLTESWSEFNRAAKGDAPITDTIQVMNAMWLAGFTVIILTGRSDEVELDSILWLEEHHARYDYMIMRRASDNRKDAIIKEEALRAIGLDNIVAAWDDSPSVIPFLRSLGITTYAVTEYAKPHAHVQSHGVEELNND